ncbi:MAG: hypothetical protein ACQEUH_08550, partial [Pseudomonadota bacterium]
LFLGKDVMIIQGEQKRFADGQRGGSGDIVGTGHVGFTFSSGEGAPLSIDRQHDPILRVLRRDGLIQISLAPGFLAIALPAQCHNIT